MSVTKVELPATFKIDGVATVYDQLKAALGEDGTIEVDGGKVEVVDFAALQLLMACAAQCATATREFSLSNLSEPLQVAIKDVGAGGLLSVA